MTRHRLHIACVSVAIWLLLFHTGMAQPGDGFVVVQVVDAGHKAIPTGMLKLQVCPYNFSRPVGSNWQDADRDSISKTWLRLPAHVAAFRLYRGGEVMEVWMDSLQVDIALDLYVDRLHWRPGSYTLFAKKVQTGVQISLPDGTSTIAAQYIRKMKLKSRKR